MRWEAMPEAERVAALNLVSVLEAFHVKNYLQTQYAEIDGKPWRYRLEVEYFLPGSAQDETSPRNYSLTERLKANYQIGGAPTEEVVFTLTQPMIDAVYALTTMTDPPSVPATPEAVEKAIPAPATPSPAAPEAAQP